MICLAISSDFVTLLEGCNRLCNRLCNTYFYYIYYILSPNLGVLGVFIYKKLLVQHPEKDTYKYNLVTCYEALNDKEIGQIAWEKYGFRTGVTGGTYDVSNIQLGVPQTITSTVTSLKMDIYNRLIEYLK